MSSRNATGTTTSTSSVSVLKDSSATFTSKVKVGDIVINENDNTSASVTAITDNNTLVLSSDIFTSATTTGKTYSVYRKYWTGFIVQDSFNLPLQDFPFLIEAYASDLIGTLEG